MNRDFLMAFGASNNTIEYGVSYIAWNLSNKQESSSIIKSSCSKVSGFKKSELSDEGKWLYHLLRKKAGLTK